MIGEQRRLDELRAATLTVPRARSFVRKAVEDWRFYTSGHGFARQRDGKACGLCRQDCAFQLLETTTSTSCLRPRAEQRETTAILPAPRDQNKQNSAKRQPSLLRPAATSLLLACYKPAGRWTAVSQNSAKRQPSFLRPAATSLLLACRPLDCGESEQRETTAILPAPCCY